MKPLFDISKNYYYIIDTSFIVFCVAASSFKEYVFSQDIPKSSLGPDFDPTVDPEYLEILRTRFKNKITTPIKKMCPFSYDSSKFIFAKDCARHKIWRRDFYPEYKLQRDTADHSKDEFDIGKVFAYAYTNLIPNFCEETGSIIVDCACAEADDIIGVLSKKISQDDPNNIVIILSSDRDMVQLCQENVIIISNNDEVREPTKELKTLTKTEITEDMDAADFTLFKILIGDAADNIPPVKRGIGPKRAIEYVKDREKLKALLNEDVNILKSFKRNRDLISMNEIPKNIASLIIENFNEARAKRDEEGTSREDSSMKIEGLEDLLN